MSSARLTRALAAERLIVTNKEVVSVGLLIRTVDNATGAVSSYVETLRPGCTVDITKKCSVQEIRRNKELQDVIVKRKIHIEDVWNK